MSRSLLTFVMAPLSTISESCERAMVWLKWGVGRGQDGTGREQEGIVFLNFIISPRFSPRWEKTVSFFVDFFLWKVKLQKAMLSFYSKFTL